MRKPRYVYLDDANDDEVQPYIDALTPKISIKRMRPRDLADDLLKLTRMRHDGELDGLIVDLRLDQVASESGRASYRAPAVAAELRTRAADVRSKLSAFPIVLWSTVQKLKQSHLQETSGADLFDGYYDKAAVVEAPEQVVEELKDLVAGYEVLARHNRGSSNYWQSVLGISADDGAALPSNFSFEETHTLHGIARLILNEVVLREGVLINESGLAARLGIERSKSRDWPKVLNHFERSLRYHGVFSNAWRRWWSRGLEQWWKSTVPTAKSLRATDAAGRIIAIKKALKLRHLTPARPIRSGYSTYFWTVCRATDLPLDPVDGLRIATTQKFSWQDPLYISTDSARRRLHVNRALTIADAERERYNRIVGNKHT